MRPCGLVVLDKVPFTTQKETETTDMTDVGKISRHGQLRKKLCIPSRTRFREGALTFRFRFRQDSADLRPTAFGTDSVTCRTTMEIRHGRTPPASMCYSGAFR